MTFLMTPKFRSNLHTDYISQGLLSLLSTARFGSRSLRCSVSRASLFSHCSWLQFHTRFAAIRSLFSVCSRCTYGCKLHCLLPSLQRVLTPP